MKIQWLRSLGVLLPMLAATLVLADASGAAAATPPTQPSTGPGGAGYTWSGATVSASRMNTSTGYTTYVPSGWTGGGAAPTKARVIVLLHGANAIEAENQVKWSTHLARKGNIVIYPAYQTHLSRPADYTPDAITGIRAALTALGSQAGPKPDTSAGVVLIGHSYGGVVAVNYAARAASLGLPKAAAILAVNPWYTTIDDPLPIPTATRIVCVVGMDDTFAGRDGCDTIWDRIGQDAAPSPLRNYVRMYSDAHGSPALTADHSAPNDKFSPVDALDWFGYWKLADGLRDCSFLGTNCAYALGNTSQQRFMGNWSDGVPVHPLEVSEVTP